MRRDVKKEFIALATNLRNAMSISGDDETRLGRRARQKMLTSSELKPFIEALADALDHTGLDIANHGERLILLLLLAGAVFGKKKPGRRKIWTREELRFLRKK